MNEYVGSLANFSDYVQVRPTRFNLYYFEIIFKNIMMERGEDRNRTLKLRAMCATKEIARPRP